MSDILGGKTAETKPAAAIATDDLVLDRDRPAFPERWADGTDAAGMTLRDYFAASAMVGVLSGRVHGANHNPKSIARFAYEMADAMLHARREEP